MIKIRGLSKETLLKALYSNKLDDFIDQFHSVAGSSGYYRMYKIHNIKIGETIKQKSSIPMPIYDEDKCPSCNASGYIKFFTAKQCNPDCACGCGYFICDKCSIKVQPWSRKRKLCC